MSTVEQALGHRAILPARHLRQLLKAQTAMESAALVARIMALVWVVSVVSVELGRAIMCWTYCVAPPEWTNYAAWTGLGAAIIPGRFFRRHQVLVKTEPGAETVAVAHAEVQAAERALFIYYLFGGLMLVSQVVAVVVLLHDKVYTFPLEVNTVALIVYAWPMITKGKRNEG